MYFCLKYEKCCKYLGDNRHEGSSYFAIVLQSVFINDKYLTLAKKKHTLRTKIYFSKMCLNQEIKSIPNIFENLRPNGSLEGS